MRARFHRRKKRIYKYMVKTKGEHCVKCERKGKMTIDHIKSIVAGGDNDYSNFQFLCDPCHRKKDKTEKTGRGKKWRKRERRAALGHWQIPMKSEWKED